MSSPALKMMMERTADSNGECRTISAVQQQAPFAVLVRYDAEVRKVAAIAAAEAILLKISN